MTRTFTLSVALLIALVADTGIARGDILREGTHPMWVALSLGPLLDVRDPEYGGFEGDAPNQFGLRQTFGVHFSGRAEGPAVAIDLQESFGDDFFVFALVPKFVYDIPLVRGLGLYLSPMAGLGYMMADPDCTCPFGWDCGVCDSYHGLTLQFGFEGKLIIGDRGLVFFRPFDLEIDMLYIDDPVDEFGTTVRYGILFGGGVIF